MLRCCLQLTSRLLTTVPSAVHNQLYLLNEAYDSQPARQLTAQHSTAHQSKERERAQHSTAHSTALLWVSQQPAAKIQLLSFQNFRSRIRNLIQDPTPLFGSFDWLPFFIFYFYSNLRIQDPDTQLIRRCVFQFYTVFCCNGKVPGSIWSLEDLCVTTVYLQFHLKST